ncbi:MAG: trehalose-phosphatase [Gammaproteobacteria bacterium]|jgi:trehalose 6-phosphate phosphatase|nr:trehalose-phosphatase [Gammaproteobacteria bacterium]MDH5176699.1 trehalose-phosphatase [Gammaproteobacteria bacterium]MDH5226420.1 trehalose-phosphatase [Gammaproteobacteria bacterium]
MEWRISDSQWCLFLDVDGTLLDIAASPDQVRVESGLHDLLARLLIVLDGAVALISGRPIVELDRLFGPHRWTAAGVHGLERRDSIGSWHRQGGIDEAAIAQARDLLRQIAERLPGTFFEDKGTAVALHYRQVPHAESQVRAEARAIVRVVGPRLSLLEGRMVVELRPAGANKADAIREFLGEAPFKGRRPIFIGDDITDQPALDAVERIGGLSVAVGDRVRAMIRVADPRDVRTFLEELADTGVPTQ